MYANNEIGTIQPMRESHQRHLPANVTACCSLRMPPRLLVKVPVNVIADGIDLLTFTAHKMYGPKGVWARYM